MPYMDGMGKEFFDPNHRCFFCVETCIYMDVSENSGFSPPKIIHLFIGFSIINHPFWGTPIFRNTHIYQ